MTDKHHTSLLSEPFQQRCVQDLAWVISSPVVISGIFNQCRWLDSSWCAEEFNECLPALRALDKDPTPLLASLATLKSQRLGLRFERFVAYWFSISPNFDLLQQNLPIRDQKRTVGELDFIIRERGSGKVIHLEVAVKFYLGKPGKIEEMSGWYGPNLQDRLDHKFQHLETHQTMLSRNYPALMPQEIDESWCLLKGRMFYPESVSRQPEFFAPEHLRGQWYLQQGQPPGESFYALDKEQWLAPIQAAKEVSAVTAIKQNPRCYAEINSGKEQQRFFVLPDTFWLQTRRSEI